MNKYIIGIPFFISKYNNLIYLHVCVHEQCQQDARGPFWAVKRLNAHIKVEFCSSAKSIKYICKYVNKGSDMVVFQIHHTNVNFPRLNDNDEIIRYQIGRYISSNEAVWRIFGFPIHERNPAIIHFAVHLENGQRPPRLFFFLPAVIPFSA